MVQTYCQITKRGLFHFLRWKLAISRKICICNRSMPSTATTVACEVSKFSLGVGLHVATSQSTFASIEGDFRFDEVQWIICWHLVMWWSFGTYQRFQYDNKITIPGEKHQGIFPRTCSRCCNRKTKDRKSSFRPPSLLVRSVHPFVIGGSNWISKIESWTEWHRYPPSDHIGDDVSMASSK